MLPLLSGGAKLNWLPLLKAPTQADAFARCLSGEGYVLIQEAARELEELTGFVFMDVEQMIG